MKDQKDSKENVNYNLKSDAVETLANADREEAPQYSQEELNRYRTKKGFHIADWVKLLLVKAWFAGSVCFFILWGLGLYVGSMLDMLFVLGVVLGMVMDVLENSIIRFMEKIPGENDPWMFFPKKGMGSFFGNIVYGCVIVVCIYMTYNAINGVLSLLLGTTDVVYLGVEPILFGTFCMGFDMLFIWIKRALAELIRKVRAV
ncbi:MAG: hypothetical protein IKT52_13335 [Oscillospiraceae bacterium]|nr:hypothetical protein [Oscillospiraceae bacterium]